MDFKDYISKYKGQRIYIQTHNFPDPDALGSAYGLQTLCKHFDVDSTLCYDGKIDKLSTKKILTEFNMEIFPKDEVPELNENSFIILVDTQKEAGNVTDFIGEEVACIDHHPTVKEIEYEYKDVRIVGACATLITHYIKKYGIIPDTNTATALLYGIKMDTNHFNRGVTDKDIEAFAYLNPLVDNEKINSIANNTMEFQDLTAYGASFDSIRVFDDIGIAYIPFPCQEALIAMISDFILALEEVRFAVVYSKRDNGWKFSARSEIAAMSAGEILHEVITPIGGNGGGHSCMAGGFIPMDIIEEYGPNADHIICDRIVEIATKLRKDTYN